MVGSVTAERHIQEHGVVLLCSVSQGPHSSHFVQFMVLSHSSHEYRSIWVTVENFWDSGKQCNLKEVGFLDQYCTLCVECRPSGVCHLYCGHVDHLVDGGTYILMHLLL